MEENYKIGITQSRTGALGGSDGNLLSQIASLGYVPKSAYKRLAVVKGLVENDNITTRVMRYGDFIEQSIFDNLSANDERYVSNPLWVSGKYSKDGVRLICHPDFILYDEEKKVLKIWECKATKFNPRQTRDTYINQLFIEWTIGNEIVKARGDGWTVQIFLCHYNTDGVDINDEFVFEPERLSIHKLKLSQNIFDIDKAMEIASEFVSNLEYYSEDDEIDSAYLPEKVKAEFDSVTAVLAEIKEKEAKVEDFKRRLCEFMQEKGIKSIKNDMWNITLVNATETVSFDSKRFLADYASKHPKKAKKLRKDYEKRIAKGAYVTIKLKNNKKD